MQTELLNRKRWKTRIELANAIFEYLEIFHRAWAFLLVNAGGEGQGRTADLPLFRCDDKPDGPPRPGADRWPRVPYVWSWWPMLPSGLPSSLSEEPPARGRLEDHRRRPRRPL